MSITILIVITTALISYQAFSNYDMKNKLLLWPSEMKQHNEFYRFITSGFVHGDFNHLLINMFVLWQFGQYMESTFSAFVGAGMGKIVFLLFYVSAIVVASIPSYVRHQDNYSYRALGASGATSALVFAFIVFNPWGWFVFPPLPAILMAIGYLIYSSYMDKNGRDNIGHNAHFWGAIYGLIFTFVVIFLSRPSHFEILWETFKAGPSMPF